MMTDQQLDIFKSDLKDVLKFIKHSVSKTELANLVNCNKAYKSLDRMAAQTISVCAGLNFNFPVGEERIDMCKAIDDMLTDARNEATNEGMLNIVAMARECNLGKDVAIQQLEKRYPLSQDEAMSFVNQNW
jgi:hypothetical protein